MTRLRAVLTDIEGTTSAISFVKEVLFPYARERLPGFVRAHGDEPEVGRWLREAAREGGIDPQDLSAVSALLVRWIDEDRKATALKALQGMIWRQGYADGDYRAHVYPDVPPRLHAWHDAGLALYVYSSGSVAAQRLFFAHSEAGDLTPLFSGYFDTETGGKREAESYRRIAGAANHEPAEILFLSDVIAELDAAAAAGMRTTLVCRPPETCPATPSHDCVASFEAIHAS